MELARAGKSVAVNYHRDSAAADSLVREIEAVGSQGIALPADVANHEAVEQLVADTVSAFGRLTIGVTNAVYSDREPFFTADLAGFRRTIDVTMWAPITSLGRPASG